MKPATLKTELPPSSQLRQVVFCGFLYVNLLAGLMLASLPQGAFAEDWRSPGAQRRAIEGTPRSGNSGGGGGSIWNIFRKDSSQPSVAEQAQQQLLTEAYNANHQAIEFEKSGDWAKAVVLFEEAARKSPDDLVIRKNLADARTWLANEQANEKDRLAMQRDKTAAANMQKAINNFAETLTVARSTPGGLDFDGGAGGKVSGGGGLDFTSTLPTASAKSATLEFGDPMVVNAQRVPSGLPPAVDTAIAGSFADAPPGVSDRVRKGFQAVTDHDWKVALAWFEDALNRDPGNVALKNLVTAANSSQPGPSASPTSKATTAQGLQLPTDDDVKLLFDQRSRAQVIADEVLMEGMDPGWKKFNADERATSLKAAQASGDAERIRLLQDMYKAYDLEKSRVSMVVTPAPAPKPTPTFIIGKDGQPIQVPENTDQKSPTYIKGKDGKLLEVPQPSDALLVFPGNTPAATPKPAPVNTPAQAKADAIYDSALRSVGGLASPANGTRPAPAPAATDSRPETPVLQLLLDALKNSPKSKYPSVGAVRD